MLMSDGSDTVREAFSAVNAIGGQRAWQVPELTHFVRGRYDPAIMRAGSEEPRSSRGVRCPTCGNRHPWDGNPHRPFCSLTCRLIDLGHWLDERYRIDTEPPTYESGSDVR